jgi:hypothetical protein
VKVLLTLFNLAQEKIHVSAFLNTRNNITATGSHSLKSSFALHAPMANATKATLFFGNHITDPTNAVQFITWSPDADGLSGSVMIENIHSGKGKSKFGFKVRSFRSSFMWSEFLLGEVTYNKLSYVAKLL